MSVWNRKRDGSGVRPRLPSWVVLRQSQAHGSQTHGDRQLGCLRATVDSPPSHGSSACFQPSPFSEPWIFVERRNERELSGSLKYFCFKCLTSCRNIGSVSVASCQDFAAVFSVVK